jgi:Domain of unknown function (DUF4823)
MTRFTAVLFIGIIVLGCADSYQVLRNNIASEAKLSKMDSIYIAVSRDGLYGSRTYAGSGSNASQVILAAFARRSQHVEMGNVHQELNEALEFATMNKFRYLVYPTILHWEDRATEWSGIPDKVEIKIDLIDVARGNTIGSSIVKGISGLATFGGDHPQDLLPRPVEGYVSSLYSTE